MHVLIGGPIPPLPPHYWPPHWPFGAPPWLVPFVKLALAWLHAHGMTP